MTKQKTTHLARRHVHIVFEHNNNLTALVGTSERYRRHVCYMDCIRYQIGTLASKIQKRRRQVCSVKISNKREEKNERFEICVAQNR